MNMNEIVREGVKGLAGAGLAVWLPTLMYSVVSNQFVLFYLVACSQALGAVCGWIMFKMSPSGALSCVPVTHVAKAAKAARTANLKKAA